MTKMEAFEEMKEQIGYEELLETLSYYNIEVRKNKIICPFPEHNDRHIGNCSVTPRGIIHCFSCGRSTNAIGLVKMQEGLEFGPALEFLWQTILGRQLPEYSRKREFIPFPIKDLKFIGLYGANSRFVWMHTNLASEEEALPDGYFKDYHSKDEDRRYLVYKKEKSDSIYDLLKIDKPMAKELIMGKCLEQADRYQKYLADFRNSETEFGRTAKDDPEFLKEAEDFCHTQLARAKGIYLKAKSL